MYLNGVGSRNRFGQENFKARFTLEAYQGGLLTNIDISYITVDGDSFLLFPVVDLAPIIEEDNGDYLSLSMISEGKKEKLKVDSWEVEIRQSFHSKLVVEFNKADQFERFSLHLSEKTGGNRRGKRLNSKSTEFYRQPGNYLLSLTYGGRKGDLPLQSYDITLDELEQKFQVDLPELFNLTITTKDNDRLASLINLSDKNWSPFKLLESPIKKITGGLRYEFKGILKDKYSLEINDQVMHLSINKNTEIEFSGLDFNAYYIVATDAHLGEDSKFKTGDLLIGLDGKYFLDNEGRIELFNAYDNDDPTQAIIDREGKEIRINIENSNYGDTRLRPAHYQKP